MTKRETPFSFSPFAETTSRTDPLPSNPSPDMLPHKGMSRRRFLRYGAGAVAAPMVLGCDSVLGLGSDNHVRLTARPGTPELTPQVGLSDLGLSPRRDGILYVPESYSPDTPAPLFVGLHGAGGTSALWESYQARAEERGMILLAPNSRSSYTWDMIARDEVGKDVEFIDAALKHTFDRCRIDPTRVALGGFPDGASYALSIGPSNGDLFTHLVAYSPGYTRSFDPIVGKPAIFISHGTEDTVLSEVNTRTNIVPGFQEDGYDVTYEQFAGAHVVPAAISESALDWFLG